jgi:RHS repeat-associated protein
MNWISCHLSQRFHFYITDHLGSVRAILDSSGNIKSTHDFEPYGVELQPLSNESTNFKYKYTGQERDNSTNLDYMHFRYYTSTMGRFLKPDSLIPNPANPQSWNLYYYVNGNPVMFNDPSGHGGPEWMGPTYSVHFLASVKEAVETFQSFGMNEKQISAAMSGKIVYGSSFGSVGIASVTATRQVTVTYIPATGPDEGPDGEMIVYGATPFINVHYDLVIDVYKIGGESTKFTPVKESLWERWKYNFIRTNKAVPGLLAPPGLGFITGKALSKGLETPSLWQWIKCGFRGVPAAGVEWTSFETFLLGGGTLVVNFLAVGAAFEVGVAAGSLIQVVVIEPLQPH